MFKYIHSLFYASSGPFSLLGFALIMNVMNGKGSVLREDINWFQTKLREIERDVHYYYVKTKLIL